MEDLITLINSNPDPRVLKRALAVKMSLQTYSVAQIATILQVSQSFVSKWKSVYLQEGSEGLGLGYEGAELYLSAENKLKALSWLKEKSHWNVSEFEDYLFKEFGVEYASKHSYYCLFHEAGLTFKKAQRTHPKKDLEAVEQKKKSFKSLPNNGQ